MRSLACAGLVVLFASCSPAHETRARPPAPPQNAASRDAGACRIAGPKASLTVAVTAGDDELSVTLDGARVNVVPRDADTSSVEVEGALAFEGRAKQLEIYPSTPIVVADGVVQLGPMSVLRPASTRGAELVARSVDIGAPFELSELSVPCSALAFVGSGHPSEAAHRGESTPPLRSQACPDPCAYYTTPETLDFRASPEGGAHVTLRGSTIVFALEDRGAWSRVSTADDVHLNGAQLVGWVERSRLTKLEGGVGFTGGSSRAHEPKAGRVGVSTPTRLAHVDAGTPVFSAPEGGARWATVRDGEADFEVALEPGRDRARIIRAPFIPYLAAAWVPAQAVHVLN